MPILDLQRRMRRLGKIRMGEQRINSKGQNYPAKLETWRLTCPVRELLDAAASLYGGDVQEWDEPKSNDRFSLITETDSLDIVLPPGDFAFSQWYEMWSGGGCQRRCDGMTEQLTDGPCQCPADLEERAEAAKDGKACKVTSRLNVILPHVPDIGIWQLEAHGYYAAIELPGSLEIIYLASATSGNLLSARLRLEQRTDKKDGKTRRYAVPVIELPNVSAGALMAGEASAGAIEAPRPALEAPKAEAPPAAAPASAERPDAPRRPAAPPLPGEGGAPPRPARQPAKKASARKAAAPRSQGSYEGGPFDENATGNGNSDSHPWSKSLHTYAGEVGKATGFEPDLLLDAVVANVLGDTEKRSTKDIPDQPTANKVVTGLRDVHQDRVDVIAEPTESGNRYRIALKGRTEQPATPDGPAHMDPMFDPEEASR